MNDNKKELFLNGHAIISIIDIPDAKPKVPDYIIALINKSKGYTVTKIKVGEDGEEIRLPHPVPLNCEYDTCAKCHAAAKYDPILVVECDDAPFDLFLFCHTDDDEKPSGWAGPAKIKPNCNYAGEVICLDLQ